MPCWPSSCATWAFFRDNREVLSVAAGHEEPLFWLTNHVGRVVATDIYGSGSFSENVAPVSMLDDPTAFAPYPYNEDRLDVRWMDARQLDFPSDTFDAVFTLSSIEHFGTASDIARAAAEIGRVLRPGGHAFIVTECFVRWHPLDAPLVQTGIRLLTGGRRCAGATPRERIVDVFTPRELRTRIVRPSGLHQMQDFNGELSERTFENVARLHNDQIEPPSGELHPHILLQAHGAPFTSVCLALAKPSSRGD